MAVPSGVTRQRLLRTKVPQYFADLLPCCNDAYLLEIVVYSFHLTDYVVNS
jgi:hypothetical protein